MRATFGSASIAALLAASAASAEITLSGDARLGIGYNIFNDGEARLETKRSVTVEEVTGSEIILDPETGEAVEVDVIETETIDTVLGAPDEELRAVSRVRFFFNAVGETESGIAFGAQVRADQAQGAQGGTRGQRSGEVFVTGDWGTLTYGDIDGADYARVGDPIGNVSLTGLGDFNELPFLSNGGGADNDELQFLANPDDRPTVRYDYDFESFGISVSTSRDLDAVGVGAGYTYEFEGDGTLDFGVGYYDFSEFTGDIPYVGDFQIPDGNQWSGSLRGSYGMFVGGVGYTSIDAGDAGKLDVLSAGAGVNVEAWRARAYYSTVTSGDELFGEAFDGVDSYGASLSYDLGGGARVAMGVARTYGADSIGEPGDSVFSPRVERVTLADFGITLSF
jgi:outer membrane protein OmpU